MIFHASFAQGAFSCMFLQLKKTDSACGANIKKTKKRPLSKKYNLILFKKEW